MRDQRKKLFRGILAFFSSVFRRKGRSRRGLPDTSPKGKYKDLVEDLDPHPDVVPQMLRMARLFGLTQQEIAEHEWMGTWIIENCDSCELGNVCFLNEKGDFVDDPGIDVKQCPNLKIYKNIAKELGKRAPIRNRIS